ncbi:ribonuclease J [Rubrobacter taiwanensis]|uniref:Ribonuclease J n=1 Tax=Rubrobacter taiwanensis TaxID=185139 RepID=A0A4R1BI48_9ACTN|nr:ribonuclease J [Rubrobacter taiwanensis]
MRVVPLGGLGEIGKNMTALRQASGMILIDAGLSFPDEEMPGIDLVLPDFTYVREHASELRGVFLTHGHEDHVGALPYLLREFPEVPVYGTRLTLELVRPKLREFGIKNAELREVRPGERVDTAGYTLEFIHVNHSIPDAVAIAAHTAAGLVVFSGDYKIDLTPIEGGTTDLSRLAALGSQGVLAYFGDSTNSERPGYVPSERVVSNALRDIFDEAPGRIIVASFASHLHRIGQVVEAAKLHDRLIAVTGRSMVRNVQIARDLGYLNIPASMMVEQHEINNIPDRDLVILTTGSQGEPLSALSRIANETHKTIRVRQDDTVIIAAHPIPGNERKVSRVINDLMKRGADVHYSPLKPVHVSGHAAQEEQKIMLSLLKPRYLVPVHGEYRHLRHHFNTAVSMGFPTERIFLLENGSQLEFRAGEARRLQNVPAGMFLIDGASFGDTASDVVVRERQQLSADGMFVVVARINAQSGELLGAPDVISRGFVYMRDADGLLQEAIEVVSSTLQETARHHITDWGELKNSIRRDLSRFLADRTGKRPIILPLIVEV